MNTAIIVAAGSGKRFGGTIPKQFLKINEKPVLIHTLERFEKCLSIDEIVLVLSENEIDNFSKVIQNFEISKIKKIVAGGVTRAESVLNGLTVIDERTAEIIAVHDGARPIVSTKEISQTIAKADEFGAACLVAKVTDTIKEVSDQHIVQTIDRKKLRRALTPQCFRYKIIKRAFDEHRSGEIVTDECFLVEQLGYEIAFIEGKATNIKITHAEDLRIAEVFLNELDQI